MANKSQPVPAKAIALTERPALPDVKIFPIGRYVALAVVVYDGRLRFGLNGKDAEPSARKTDALAVALKSEPIDIGERCELAVHAERGDYHLLVLTTESGGVFHGHGPTAAKALEALVSALGKADEPEARGKKAAAK